MTSFYLLLESLAKVIISLLRPWIHIFDPTVSFQEANVFPVHSTLLNFLCRRQKISWWEAITWLEFYEINIKITGHVADFKAIRIIKITVMEILLSQTNATIFKCYSYNRRSKSPTGSRNNSIDGTTGSSCSHASTHTNPVSLLS